MQASKQASKFENGVCARAPRGADRRPLRAARPGIARRRSRRLCPRRCPCRRRPCHRVHAITVSMSCHRACHTVCEVCVRAHLACHVGVRVHARFTRMRHVRMRMKRERERERERVRVREREREREARERSASPNYIVYGKMQHDRAGPARHEDPVLPSRDVNRTQLRAGLQTTSSPVDLPLSLPHSPLSLFT